MRTQARRQKQDCGKKLAGGVCEGIEEKRKSEGAAGGAVKDGGGGRAGTKMPPRRLDAAAAV